MHVTTLQQAKYFLKTKQGLSTTSYSHLRLTPVYGNGQGAGDSPSQCWSQESAMLFDLYEQQVCGASFQMRDGTTTAKIPLTAFADDTNLLGNDDDNMSSIDKLVIEARIAFQTWDRLLHAAGHFMDLGKCACYLSI
jgi:hypothetical protein